jgi:2-dehydro-3-deoxygalactonokinase
MMILTIATSTTRACATLWRRAADGLVALDERVGGNAREAISAVLGSAGLGSAEPDLILASGAIASGLAPLATPARLEDLAAAMVCGRLPETGPRPVWFIPGLHTLSGPVGLHNCEAMDRLEGEETAAMGFAQGFAGPAVLAFVGAESRYLHLDEGLGVSGSVTTLSGQLFDALAGLTGLTEASPLDAEMLAIGSRQSADFGLGRSAFLVRLLDRFCPYSRGAKRSLLLGAVLGADLQTLKNSRAIRMNPVSRFVISGEPWLAEALAKLVEADEFFSGTVSVIPDTKAGLAARGALAVARARGLVPG